jgi:HSP20 family protein
MFSSKTTHLSFPASASGRTKKKTDAAIHRVETGYGTFTRTLPLPDTADGDKISAEFRNGELFITIPKLKEKAGKKIKIS